MPIVPPRLPADALAAIRRGLEATGFARGRGALSLSLPLPLLTAGLKALAAERPLTEASKLTAWRALVEEDKKVVAAAEAPVSDGKVRPSGASINRGAFVESTVDGLRLAERHERVESERFGIRLLRVPALHVVALWLHTPEPKSDLFIPLAPAPAPLRADASYEAPQFESEVQRMAKLILSTHEAAARSHELGS